jgi:hypothetical protein
VLVRRAGADVTPRCPRCQNTAVQRLVSRFAAPRSEEEHFASLADPARMADVDENDPRSVARWARQMQRSMGEDLGPEFDEMIEQIEAGELDEESAGGPAGAGDDDLGWAEG